MKSAESIEDSPYLSGGADVGTQLPDFSWGGVFAYIVVFLLILVVVLWIIRRLNRSQFSGLDSSWARVLDRQSLGGQQTLYLVEIAGKFQVLGGSDHSLVKIAEIEDLEAVAEIIDEIAHRSESRPESLANTFWRRLFYGKKRRRPFDSELQRMLEEKDHADKL